MCLWIVATAAAMRTALGENRKAKARTINYGLFNEPADS